MRLSVRLLSVVALLLPTLAAGQQLIPTTEPVLVECENQPCFRVLVNAVDAQGNPQPLSSAPSSFRVYEGDKSHKVFYSSALDVPGGGQRPTYWMLLLDMSGSMNARLGRRTRFDAARDAIRAATGMLRDGVDHFAFVPFESHAVRAGIARTVFESSRAASLARLDALKPPPASNNTALYTAIYEALDVLKGYQQRGLDVSLVVFTDGKNDVRPERGDDRDLLGSEGLDIVRRRAREYNIQVKTVGFGARGEATFDENALRQLAWPDERQYGYAADADAVSRILPNIPKALASRVQITFGPVRATKGQLTGRTLAFRLTADNEGKPIETRGDIVWSAPPIQEPSFADALSPAEEKAFIESTGSNPPVRNPWLTRLMALGVFSGLLAIGWFGLPRVVWPERYIPRPNFPTPEARFQPPAGAGLHTPQVPHMPGGAAPDLSRSSPRVPSGGRSPGKAAPAPPRPPGQGPRPRGGQTPDRDPGESTIYIPRGKKYEKDS